jgi:hypothetical protein
MVIAAGIYTAMTGSGGMIMAAGAKVRGDGNSSGRRAMLLVLDRGWTRAGFVIEMSWREFTIEQSGI